jgi:hypothetical protein
VRLLAYHQSNVNEIFESVSTRRYWIGVWALVERSSRRAMSGGRKRHRGAGTIVVGGAVQTVSYSSATPALIRSCVDVTRTIERGE